MTLFLPWNGSRQINLTESRQLFFQKRKFPLEDLCFKTNAFPCFSLPNPSGTVRSFLDALEKDSEAEALSYLSSRVATEADMDSIKNLFMKKKMLIFFSDDILNEIRTVCLACQSEKGKTEVISVHMIAEPDHYGKWKIFRIEKE